MTQAGSTQAGEREALERLARLWGVDTSYYDIHGREQIASSEVLVEVGKRHYPWLPVAWMLRHRFDLVKVAPAIKSPLLCIAAMQDDVIPAAHARRLYDAWGGPRQWLALEGAGHNSTDGVPAFWQGIVAFLQESRF